MPKNSDHSLMQQGENNLIWVIMSLIKRYIGKHLSHHCLTLYCIIYHPSKYIICSFLKYFLKGRYHTNLAIEKKKVANYVYNTGKVRQTFIYWHNYFKDLPLKYRKVFWKLIIENEIILSLIYQKSVFYFSASKTLKLLK